MKSKVLAILAMLLIAISPILAKVGGVSVDELVNKDKFKEFEKVNKKVVENFLASRGQSNKAGKQEILHYNKKAVGRVYHLEPSGYVVATLNRNEVPIKAYSFSGSFDNLPEEYKEFLSARLYEYSEMMDKAEKTQVINSDNKKIWEYLENYTEDSPKPIIESSVIDIDDNNEIPPEPPIKTKRVLTQNKDGRFLVDTSWNQGNPYNMYTEERTVNGVTENAPTGCTNTAWAQIMKFHEWPIQPVGETESYEWEGLTLSKNLNNSQRYFALDFDNNYNWQNMPNNSGNAEVATLMADIGYALQSDWLGSGGGTAVFGHTPEKLEIISRHFGYSTSMYLTEYKDFTSSTNYDQYKSTITNNINRLQPLFTMYMGPGGSHSVVADGYRNIITSGVESFELHLNIGWGRIPSQNEDWYVMTYNSSGELPEDDFPGIGEATGIVSVGGIKPCEGTTTCHSDFISDSVANSTNNNGIKEGLTLTSGWNLVSLISSGNDIDYRDFTNAYNDSSVKIYYVTDNGTEPGTWVSAPTQIVPLQGIWVNHSGTKTYVFPGSKTEAVELTPTAINTILNTSSFNSDDWALIGTGKEITNDRLKTFKACQMYITSSNQWINCKPTSSGPIYVPAGTGMWVQKY